MGTKKLAILCRAFAVGAGGMEKTAAGVANAMTGRGWSVSMFYHGSDASQSVYSLDPGVARHEIPREGSLPKRYAEAIRSSEPDVCLIMASDCTAVPYVARIAELEVPIVIHEGSNPERIVGTNWSERKGLSVLEAQRERDAMATLAVKVRVTLPEYRNSFPTFLQPDVVAFPNAFRSADPEFRETRDRQTRRRFINIGGLKRVKNLHVAALAFARMAEDFPLWDFVVYSARPESGSVLSEVCRIIAVAGLDERFVIRHPVSDIYAEYAKSHVHVISSLSEGLPNCVAEAMCHALPSIGFDRCPGTNALIVSESNGLLADASNQVASLEVAMRSLAGNDALRIDLGEQALIDSAAFAPERVFDTWEALLGEAAEAKPSLSERLAARLDRAGCDARKYRNIQQSALGFHPRRPPLRDSGNPVISIVVTHTGPQAALDVTLRALSRGGLETQQIIVVAYRADHAAAQTFAQFSQGNGNWVLIGLDAKDGPSQARNRGLDAVFGEYVQFWESGDSHESVGFNKILQEIRNKVPDVAIGALRHDGAVPSYYHNSRRNISSIMIESELLASCRSMLFRKSTLVGHGIRFEPAFTRCDVEFNLKVFAFASSIVVMPDIIGECRTTPSGSPSSDVRRDEILDVLSISERTERYYRDNWCHWLEASRQRNVLEQLFLDGLEVAMSSIYQPANTGWSAARGADTAIMDQMFGFLNSLRSQLFKYEKGIRALLPDRPAHALAFAALRGGLPLWACEFSRGQVPPRFDALHFPAEVFDPADVAFAVQRLLK